MPSILNKLVKQVVTKSSWDSVFIKNMDQKLFGQSVESMPYSKSELVYICINHTQRAIGQVPIQIVQPSKRKAQDQRFINQIKSFHATDPMVTEKLIKTGELEPVPSDNPYQELIDYPNRYTNSQHFKEALVGFTMLNGNVWIVQWPYMTSMAPDALWIVKQDNMKPIINNNNQLDYWNYTVSGKENDGVPLDLEAVMHIKLWNPYDPIMGLSPLDPASIAMRSDFKASVFNESFFDNSAVPGGILSTTQKLGDKQFSRASSQFQERHSGYQKGHKVALLEQGLTWTATGLSQSDMQFLDLRKYDKETIMQIFGTKKAILGITDDINYATAREQRKEWWQDTNIPIMKLISCALNFGLLRNTPYIARWDISQVEALHEDYKSKVETAKKLWEMGFTANELNERFELGFQPKSWRDVAYYPGNLMVVSGNNQSENEPDSDDEDEDEDETRFLEGKAPLLITEKTTNKNLEAEHLATLHRLENEASATEKKFESKVSKVFFNMRRKVLEVFYQNIKTPSDVELLEFAAEMGIISKQTASLYAESINLATKVSASETGGVVLFDSADSMAIEFMKKKEILITKVVDTVKRNVRKEIVSGLINGEAHAQIAERIKKVFNVSASRASVIARTEVGQAMNFARNQQLRRSQFEWKQWFTAMVKVRPSHQPMHGMIIRMEEPWIVGGATLMYPRDPAGPAGEVINCRCIEVVSPRGPK